MLHVPLEWHALRPWRGSQHRAFEELCAQLAAAESAAPGAVFERKGAPDGGVECYWRLVSGDERAWQAKFFDRLDDFQWKQLDESVSKALEKHPHLVEYIICVPLDFADPRREGQQFAMDRWRQHVAKWDDWARERNMRVEFT